VTDAAPHRADHQAAVDGVTSPAAPHQRLTISAVIPAHNAAEDIRHCLSALLNGERVPDEIIVVDDGSSDGTAAAAAAFGVTILLVNGRRGAAYPRNAGARHATGDLLLFVDADVTVHSDAVRRIADQFERNPGLTALMGSYDESPSCPELLSQYRNLMHCYTHQHASRVATTFWTGCGAVRRAAFESIGGFNESFRAMEDIELGRRLHASGYRIELDPAIQGKHRKRWTLSKMVLTDIFHRGIPWTLILLRDGSPIPNELNLKWCHRLCVLGVGLLILLATYASLVHGGRFLTPLIGAALLVSGTYWTTQCLQPDAVAVRWTLASFLGAYTALSYSLDDLVGPAVVLGGYTFLWVRHVYLLRHERARRSAGRIYGCLLVGALAYLIVSMPGRYEVVMFWLLATAIVGLNLPFYLFLCRRLGNLFALAAVPFHFMFYFYGGLSFGLGLCQYWMEKPKLER
jgi:glycosyltransferase involved in cell wall biosynthesis